MNHPFWIAGKELEMKEKIKISILISFMIILIIFIIFVTILFITKNKDNNNNNDILYNTWNAYKTEVVRDDDIIYTIETFNAYLNINKNNSINICYQENGEKICNTTSYSYENSILSITENDLYLNGSYKVDFKNDIMILENIQNNDGTIIRHYYQKSEG